VTGRYFLIVLAPFERTCLHALHREMKVRGKSMEDAKVNRLVRAV